MKISNSPVGLWFIGTNTCGKGQKKLELALIGTQQSHKIRGNSTKTKKIKFIKGGKVGKSVVDIGTLLSVAQNTWHPYKNEKKSVHQRGALEVPGSIYYLPISLVVL